MRSRVSMGLMLIRRAGWAPVVVFLLHAFLSRGLDAYTRFPPLDIPMHILGGIAIAYFFACCFSALPGGIIASDIRGLAESVLVSSLTATAAVVWEFAEFISDRIFATGAQKGLEDTLLDMALGIVGGLVYLAVSFQTGRLGRPRPLEHRPGAR